MSRYDYSHYNLKQSPKEDELPTLIHLQDRLLLYQQLYCERQESYKTLVKNSDALPGNKTPMILTSKALPHFFSAGGGAPPVVGKPMKILK